MKSKHILLIGIILFLMAFIFPPYKYHSVNDATPSNKNNQTIKIAIRPIWNGTKIYNLKGNLIGKDAVFDSLLWFGILFVIGMGTRTLARFIDS